MKIKSFLLCYLMILFTSIHANAVKKNEDPNNEIKTGSKAEVIGYADKAMINQCPYEIKSEDAQTLITDVTGELSKYKEKLKDKKDQCSIGEQGIEDINNKINSMRGVIDQLSKNQFPDDQGMASLLIANQPFQCSSNVNSLNQFLNAYIPQAINDAMSGIKSEQLGGNLGQTIEQTIQDCYDQNKPDKTKIESCVYAQLYGSAQPTINTGSYITKQWLSDCRKVKDLETTKWVRDFEVNARENEAKQAVLSSSIESILNTSGEIANSISRIDESNCKGLLTFKSTTNALLQNILSTTGALAGPVGTLGAAMVSPSLQAIINRIGSEQRKINKVSNMESEFLKLNENQHEKFSCILFRANLMNCEYLSRTYYKPIQACEITPVDKSLVTLTNLSNLLQFQVGASKKKKEKNKKEAEKIGKKIDEVNLTDENKADAFYQNMFEKNLTTEDGKTVNIYDYIYQNDGILDKITKNFPNSTNKAQLKASIQKLEAMKNDLEQFKLKYEKTTESLSSNQSEFGITELDKSLEFIESDEYLYAVDQYIRIKQMEDGGNPNAPLSKVKKDMRTSIAMNSLTLLEPEVPYQSDKTANLAKTLGTFYEQFLGEGSFIKKGYKKSLKKNVDSEIKEAQKEIAKKEYNANPNAFFDKVIYPRYRDCMLNYQFAINPGKEGQSALDENYVKSCSFLGACKDFPIQFNEGAIQADYGSIDRKAFKACDIVSKYRFFEQKIREDFAKDKKICGQNPEDLFK